MVHGYYCGYIFLWNIDSTIIPLDFDVYLFPLKNSLNGVYIQKNFKIHKVQNLVVLEFIN